MKSLFVLYDGECGFCRKCREWLGRQPTYVELRFLPMRSREVKRRFPGIEQYGLGEELLVVSDDGAVYQGTSAWIMCLYALVEYREWSERLAHPALLPMARRAFELLSSQRARLSRWFVRGDVEEMQRQLATEPETGCAWEGTRKDELD